MRNVRNLFSFGLLAVTGLALLTGCPSSSVKLTSERIQVAPNRPKICEGGLNSSCLIIRIFNPSTQKFSGWLATTSKIRNFDYYEGYAYDLDVSLSCGNKIIGDALIEVELIKLNSKTPATEFIDGTDSGWPGLC
jgi:hypothetical protein